MLGPTPRSGAYWGSPDPRQHAVQIYSSDTAFLDSLEGFIGAALRNDEAVIVIATAGHLHELEMRLRKGWIDLDRARWEDRYIAMLSSETLERISIDGSVNEARMHTVMGELLARARGPRGNRKVRAFGEMVAELWGASRSGEALSLEGMWTRLQVSEKFPLFCAYPRSLFKLDSQLAINAICAAHNHVVPGYIA
jgi:hypothetical protein